MPAKPASASEVVGERQVAVGDDHLDRAAARASRSTPSLHRAVEAETRRPHHGSAVRLGPRRHLLVVAHDPDRQRAAAAMTRAAMRRARSARSGRLERRGEADLGLRERLDRYEHVRGSDGRGVYGSTGEVPSRRGGGRGAAARGVLGSDKANQASSSSGSSSSASSSGSPDTSASSDVATTTTIPAKLSQALCDAFAADVQRRVANAQVDIADAQRGAAAGAARRRHGVVAGDGRGRRRCGARRLGGRAGDPHCGPVALAAAWGDTGAALAQQAQAQGKHSIEAFVLVDGIDVPGGKIVTLGALGRVAQRNLGRLVVGCQDQALGLRAEIASRSRRAGRSSTPRPRRPVPLPTSRWWASTGLIRRRCRRRRPGGPRRW